MAAAMLSSVGVRRVSAIALFGGPLLIVALLFYTGMHRDDVSLLQQPQLQSAAYYQQLAHSDAWLAGPSQLKSQRTQLQTRVKARMQSLTDWNSGALAGTASYVTECANGNNAACDKLIADPGAISALKHVDAANPQGYTAEHPHGAQLLHGRPALPAWRRTAAARAHALREQQYARMAALRRKKEAARAGAWEKSYTSTPASTRAEWNTAAWKSGTLNKAIDDDWLRSCGQGNYYACQHLASNDDALHDILHPHHRLLHKIKRGATGPPLAPVFVAPTPPEDDDDDEEGGGGLVGSLLSSLGLGDTFVPNDDKPQSVRMAKMVPDAGLEARGHHAVYNDGTVGEFSDESS